ncbi:hypothetical protein U1Q18_007739 [Sarracenia purpurea var. burkii]
MVNYVPEFEKSHACGTTVGGNVAAGDVGDIFPFLEAPLGMSKFFNPTIYAHRAHPLGEVVMWRWEPMDATDTEILLHSPNEHLSYTNSIVDGVGFQCFILILERNSGDHIQLTALTERWWDTTNTLHFSTFEATITPLAFAIITSVRVGGYALPYDPYIV